MTELLEPQNHPKIIHNESEHKLYADVQKENEGQCPGGYWACSKPAGGCFVSKGLPKIASGQLMEWIRKEYNSIRIQTNAQDGRD